MQSLRVISKLNIVGCRMLNSTTSSVTRIRRAMVFRTYPTVLVQPDGSTINVRYHEPRKIVTLPLDLKLLSEAERKERIDRRKPKKQVKIEEEIEDSFNAKKYYMKK